MSSFQECVYRTIGKNLRKYRKQAGLSQEKLSEILDVNCKFIGHVERYERSISLKRLIQLAEFFMIDMKEFFKEV